MGLKKPDYYIVIGASAGGLNATTELVSQLSEDINAAVFVVLHLSKVGIGDFLVHRLQKYTTYTCMKVTDGMAIERHKIYVAPPDEHLVIRDDHVVLGRGPAENRWRPSVDVLFRSAAANHASQVIGIVLTGYLNDGTDGMLAIKRSGGVCIVQDPNEAEYPDMPMSVIEHVEVDYSVSLQKMGEVIRQAISLHGNGKPAIVAPDDVVLEARIAENAVVGLNVVSNLGERSLYVCPDCGGGLWQMRHANVERYRCHVGHVYTEEILVQKQAESLESTLWVALRMMEERRNLLMSISSRESTNGFPQLSNTHKEKAEELEQHIVRLKELLFAGKDA
ncbi:chemotaxis protein CheB [Segetibacter sp. 3557_3]|uniref:chemotaxis protein CheB n=1 Tax=Segetibacter sp. 3557_3 TaxID=2547429 RepID=UPI001404FC69|nr:chemotaxis protein CheB [Segetibacter sp. 3557_3]